MNRRGRRLRGALALWLMRLAVALFIVLLLSIIIAVLVKGAGGLSLDLVTRLPESGFYLGRGGGVLNAIVGSLLVAGGATMLAAVLSLPLVLYINIYLARQSRPAAWVRFSLDVLWGVPSIVYGAAGVAVMLLVGLRGSLLAAVVVVAVIEVPILARTADEVVRLVPRELEEAALSLGADRRTVAWRVVTREALPGIVTAILLAFGRGIGDAAAVMLVSGYQDGLPVRLTDPVATLPLAVFNLVNMPQAAVRARGYAASLVLVALVLVFSLLARLVSGRLARYQINR
jgi:phosphate transport system permease protein